VGRQADERTLSWNHDVIVVVHFNFNFQVFKTIFKKTTKDETPSSAATKRSYEIRPTEPCSKEAAEAARHCHAIFPSWQRPPRQGAHAST
jgi:hypothetical protein